jgi:exopolyphosphatase / guanosine-5'-triphosphate,3'-diphosphate pyrophosphatase
MPRYAAIDIGSNSVRMQAAEIVPGHPVRILAAEREVTRLGTSVFRDGRISPETVGSLCTILARMAAVYKTMDVIGVRAVATSAVRDASNQAEFIDRASQAIGTPVEIISGSEEARLIQLGVQLRWPQVGRRALICDVGGGSAEIIASEEGRMVDGVSRPLGAVRLTEVFMKQDPPGERDLHQMETFIREKLSMAVKRLGPGPFDRMIATSASAAALVCAVNRVPRGERDQSDRLRASTAQVRALYRELCARDLGARRKIAGIGPRRAEIIVPGAAVFLQVLEAFGLRSMYYSLAGVRDGIISDLHARGVGREITRLSREQVQVVESMAKKYGVQVRHARKVAALAHALFESLQPMHRLSAEHGKLLEAAAYLHDIGHFVSDTGHHKHSLYLVLNSDMPGFTDRERLLSALLCRYHRKTMPTPRHIAFQNLGADLKRAVTMLAPLLRVADALDTSKEQPVLSLSCDLRGPAVVVNLHSEGNTELEVWAAERAGAIFRQVYERPMVFVRARPAEAR